MDSSSIPEEFQKKIVDTPSGPKCICDMCGKKGKIGALSSDRITGEPLIICNRCELKIRADREGVSEKEAARRRKRTFAVLYLFQDIKLADYLAWKNKKELDSLEEANLVFERIITAWNGLTTEERRSFDEKTDGELNRIYKQIKVDFSGL